MVVFGYVAFTAASSTALRESVSEQAGNAQKKLPLPQAPQAQVAGKPNAPSVVGVTATLTDNTPQATKVAPGGTINYTAVISSTGGAGENATAVNFNAPLDANTTYTGGTVHASPHRF